ncbi:MAG: nickel-dependent hydrogenase large subunit, partial [Chromatiaceae bacterium]|nr:nickel-dependent hydrogenase large subunit [Chromatiaceae bacterium]
MTRVVVDPITRIEGHLRIEAQMNGGIIEQAYSSGTSVRGLETIVQGRDPREVWAFVQRICGVCTLVHGIAGVRAVEDALDYKIPPNAELIRNLMIGSQYVHDHVMHFYHLHALDWVDLLGSLQADPKKTSELAQSIGTYAKTSPGYFADVQKRLKGFVEGGQLGIFANGYWGHPAYKLPPEANLMAVAHYLDALAWQRNVAELHAIFGGKNPHPNLCVGGMPCAISLESGKQAGTALDVVGLERIRNIIQEMHDFVHQVYVPDTIAIAGFYKDWFQQGEGVGNFMTYGDFPAKGYGDPESYLIPTGVILNRDLSHIEPVDLDAEAEIQEFVSRAWYDYKAGKDAGLHPYQGETTFAYTGPEPPYKQLDVLNQYSWLKTPRWKGKPMEVGPLARMLMLYTTGNEKAKALADSTLQQLDLPIDALYSTMGRTAARTLETALIVDELQGWYDNLVANIKSGD